MGKENSYPICISSFFTRFYKLTLNRCLHLDTIKTIITTITCYRIFHVSLTASLLLFLSLITLNQLASQCSSPDHSHYPNNSLDGAYSGTNPITIKFNLYNVQDDDGTNGIQSSSVDLIKKCSKGGI
jgi:hypothetical protein